MKKVAVLMSAMVALLFNSCSKDELPVNNEILEDNKVFTEMPSPENNSLKAGGIKSKFWTNGSTISVKFLDGSATQINNVKARIAQWEQYANLKFNYTTGSATVRISFVADAGSWSYVGTDANYITDQTKPTVNFGWLRDNTSSLEYDRVVLHEFGHVLGLVHEHQLPSTTVCWNKEALYTYYANNHGWTKAQVDQNIINQYSVSQTQYSAFDPSSIMTYSIPASFTTCGWSTPSNTQLSNTDKSFIGQVYPFTSGITNILVSETRPITDLVLTIEFTTAGYKHYDYEYIGTLDKLYKLQLNGGNGTYVSANQRYEGNFLSFSSTVSGKGIQINKTDLRYFSNVRIYASYVVAGYTHYDWEDVSNYRSTTLNLTGMGASYNSSTGRYEGNLLSFVN